MREGGREAGDGAGEEGVMVEREKLDGGMDWGILTVGSLRGGGHAVRDSEASSDSRKRPSL